MVQIRFLCNALEKSGIGFEFTYFLFNLSMLVDTKSSLPGTHRSGQGGAGRVQIFVAVGRGEEVHRPSNQRSPFRCHKKYLANREGTEKRFSFVSVRAPPPQSHTFFLTIPLSILVGTYVRTYVPLPILYYVMLYLLLLTFLLRTMVDT